MLVALVVLPSVAVAIPRLRAYRVGEHQQYDRIVWQFSGGLPGWNAQYVRRVTADGSGAPVRLIGRAFLKITLTGLAWGVHDVPREPTLTPRFAVLRQLKPAGVFEGYFTFGLGLSRKASTHLFTLRHPDRLVLDLRR